MWRTLVVVVKPFRQLLPDGVGRCKIPEVDVIAFEGLHKGLLHAVALRRGGRPQHPALERDLGVKLFEKAGRNLALTDQGRVAFRYADEIFSLGREFRDAVRGRPTGRPVRFAVGLANAVPTTLVTLDAITDADAGRVAEINDYCRCDVLDTYFVFLRSRVIVGQLSLDEEQGLVAEAKTWLLKRVKDLPIYGTYVERWGDWKNPWKS